MTSNPIQAIPYGEGTVLARVWPEALREGDRMHYLDEIRTVRRVGPSLGAGSLVTFTDGGSATMFASIWVLRDEK